MDGAAKVFIVTSQVNHLNDDLLDRLRYMTRNKSVPREDASVAAFCIYQFHKENEVEEKKMDNYS